MRLKLIIVSLSLAALVSFVPLAQGACIKRHDVRIASGSSPNGWQWTVDGTIGNNGSCDDWLLGMDFSLVGATNWGWATGIPSGGHLSPNFEISSSDDLLEDGSYRVFSGSVSGRAAKVQITLSNNKRIAFRPKSPSHRLRQNVVWLRNMRYFVEYYPPEGFVTGVATFDASGVLLYRDKSYEDF